MALEELKTRNIDDIDGLFIIIVQDKESNEVLMQAFANKEAVEKTIKTGKAHYYSTSRKKLWLKGESSGNFQMVDEVLVDCDADALIYKVDQKGGACHKGYRTCFYRKIQKGELTIIGEKIFDPKEVYK